MEPDLGPCENPGNGTERFHAAGLALLGARSNIHEAELALGRHGAEVVDKPRLLVHNGTVLVARHNAHSFHGFTPLVLCLDRAQHIGLEDSRGVRLERLHREPGEPKVLLDYLALNGHAQVAVDRVGGLRENGNVLGPASAAHSSSTTVKESQLHSKLGRHLGHGLLGFVQLPVAGDATAVLGGVTVPHHDLLDVIELPRDNCAILLVFKQHPERVHAPLQGINGFEQRGDAEDVRRVGPRELALQYDHSHHIGRRHTHRNDVSAEILLPQLRDDFEGLQYRLSLALRGHAFREERALRGERLGEVRHALVLVPFGVGAVADELGDGVEGLGVPPCLLANVELDKREPKGGNPANQVEQGAVGHLALVRLVQGAIHDHHGFHEFLSVLQNELRNFLRQGTAEKLVFVVMHGGKDSLTKVAQKEAVGLFRGNVIPEFAQNNILLATLLRKLLVVLEELIRRVHRGEAKHEVRHFLEIKLRGPEAVDRRHLPGGLRKHKRITVAIAAGPRPKHKRLRVQRHPRHSDFRQRRVHRPDIMRHGVPHGLLQHLQRVPRLVLRRRLRPSHLIRVPHRDQTPSNLPLDLLQLQRRRGLRGLLEQRLGDGVELVEDGAAQRLRGVLREHHLDGLLGQRLVDLLGGVPLGLEVREGLVA
mmetsp:Transcript_5593/g.13511  ORF Transcript_5593/g.13511 Transcript_5593/m.13511 type:complete len:650 (-) Transcript_5593:298-2247(-)